MASENKSRPEKVTSAAVGSSSMRRTLTFAVGIGLAAFGIIFFLVFNLIMPNMLKRTEAKYVEEQKRLVNGLLEATTKAAVKLAHDLTNRAETASFILGENDRFIEENWRGTTIAAAYEYNFIFIKDHDGRDVYSEFYDFKSKEALPEPLNFSESLAEISAAVIAGSSSGVDDPLDRKMAGIFFLGGVPYLSATLPVARDGDFNNAVGTVTFGVALSGRYLKDLTLYDTAEFLFLKNQEERNEYSGSNPNATSSTLTLENIWGDPISLVIIDRRIIYAEGVQVLNVAELTLAGVIVLFALSLYVMFRKIVFKPLEALSRDVDSASAVGEVNVREYSNTYELISLGDSINEMLGRLDSAQVSENSLLRILNGMDAFLYVSDAQTDELLFINNKLIEHFEIAPGFIGKKCWEVFRTDGVGHCPDCTLKFITDDSGSIYSGDFQSSFNDRHYRHTDCFIGWTGGRRAHLRGMIDITDRVNAEVELQHQLRQQELMSMVSVSFISEEDIEILLERALNRVGEFLAVDRLVISKADMEAGTISFFAGWKNMSQDNIPLQPLTLNFSPGNRYYDAFVVDGLPHMASKGLVNKSGLADDEVRLDRLDEHSFLCAPIMAEGKVWGLVALGDRDPDRVWSDNDKQFFALLSSLISGVVSRDIARQGFILAKEHAEESSRAKSDFLSRMSHEMRTPMNAIIGMTNIAKHSDDPSRKEYCLDKIDEASKHLLGVINDILDMSKIEAAKFEISYAGMDFKKMIQRIVDVLNFGVDKKNQKLVVELDPNLPTRIVSDDQRLSQVITNLVGNAIKFTPENGTITISATLLREEAGICDIQVDISDTGIGISEEQLSRLFRSFEQADGGISRRFGGTGLGLAISKSIIELMGGEVWVTSELGHGSVFSFSIKAERIDDDAGEAVEAQAVGVEEAPCFPGKRILLAEDVEINREIVLALLEPTGIEIDCAENGIEAVRMFTRAPELYDMIFMDIHMPDMDGYEASIRIRTSALSTADTIPIVAMTANVFREDIRRCLACGMNDHVAKPIDMQDLYLKLHQYLKD